MDTPLNPLTVRAMLSADIDAIMPIERQIYAFPWTAGNFRDSLRSGYDAWVLDDPQAPPEARIIGYALVMRVLDEAHLLNLSIAASRQRGGLGRRLLQWVLDNTARQGASGLFLEVRPSNEIARELYVSTGFVQIGVRRNYYPAPANEREDALVMRCPLAAPLPAAS
ncbi:MAG: ribosomal protein S18-alanine N-acetyltransferase [Burkholderiaceae bacterium]